MPLFVIAAYRPKPGKEQELLEVLRDHMPILRLEGLVTDRPAYVMRAAVAALWARFEAACDYIAPASVLGCDGLFPTFEPVEM
jgi:hypothetical protein